MQSLGQKKSNNRRGYFFAVIAALGWSTGGLISHWLMTSPGPATKNWVISPLGYTITPTVLSGSRALSATLILGLILIIGSRKTFRLPQGAKSLVFLVPFGALALAGMHFTYFKAISLSNVTTAILLEYLAPIFTLAFGVLVYKHKPTGQMLAGVFLAILGCAVVVGAFNGGGLLITPKALFWGLAAAVFFAFYSIMGGVGSERFDSLTLLFYGLFFAALMWLVVLGPKAVMAPFKNPHEATAIIIMACVSTIIPFGAYLISLKYISPTHASITAMLEPVTAGILSWALFGDKITWSLAVGGAVIVFAIVLIQLSDANKETKEFPFQD
ncbi:MAG: EamA family transporter [Coriobacteriia bacterium]|nr:EamA family transporter [Coriobacteriia bacterium]